MTLLTDLGCHIAFFFQESFWLRAWGPGMWWLMPVLLGILPFQHMLPIYVSIHIYIYIFKYLHIYISIHIRRWHVGTKDIFFDGNGEADIHTSSRIHTKMHSTCSSDVSQTSITYFLLYVFFSPILCSLSFCRFPLPTTTIFMQCLCMTLDSVEAKHLLNYIFFCASFILQSDICLFLWIMFDCIINLLLSVGLLLLHYTGLRWWCQLLRRWVQALFEKWSWYPWKYRASWPQLGVSGVVEWFLQQPSSFFFSRQKPWGLDRNMWESFWQTNVMGRENKYGQMLICNDTKVATFAGAKVSFLCGSAWYVACNGGQNGILWEKVLVLDIFIWIVYFIRLCKWNITTKWHIW